MQLIGNAFDPRVVQLLLAPALAELAGLLARCG